MLKIEKCVALLAGSDTIRRWFGVLAHFSVQPCKYAQTFLDNVVENRTKSSSVSCVNFCLF